MLAETEANVFFSDNETLTYGVLPNGTAATTDDEQMQRISVVPLDDHLRIDSVGFLQADDPWFVGRKQVRCVAYQCSLGHSSSREVFVRVQ